MVKSRARPEAFRCIQLACTKPLRKAGKSRPGGFAQRGPIHSGVPASSLADSPGKANQQVVMNMDTASANREKNRVAISSLLAAVALALFAVVVKVRSGLVPVSKPSFADTYQS